MLKSNKNISLFTNYRFIVLHIQQASYDRHLYITSPLHYNTTSRKRRLRITIPIVWAYSLVLGVIPLAPSLASNRDSYKTCIIYKLYPSLFLVVLIGVNCYALYAVVFGFYVHIWSIATRHKRRITKMVMCKSNGGSLESVSGGGPKMNWKSTKLLAMITVSLFILNVPYTIALIYLVFCDGSSCKVNFLVLLFIYVAFYAATCVNFIIYVYYSKDFKMAFKLILLSCIGKNRNADAKHKRPNEAPEIKQTFKTDKHLDCVSPPPRRKFAVAGLEFNRHLPKAAISYIHGNKKMGGNKTSETVAHVYENNSFECAVDEDKNEKNTDGNASNYTFILDVISHHEDADIKIKHDNSSPIDKEVPNTEVSVLTDDEMTSAPGGVESNDNGCHSETGDEVYTILRATDHITRYVQTVAFTNYYMYL